MAIKYTSNHSKWRNLASFMDKLFFAKRTLRNRFTILTVFIVLLPMVVTGIYVFTIIKTEAIDQANQDISLLIQQINENVDQKFKTIDDFTKLIISNKTIRDELLDLSINDDEYKAVEAKINVENEIKYISIFGYSAPGTTYLNNNFLRRIYLFKNTAVFYKGVQNDGLKVEHYDSIHQEIYRVTKDKKTENAILPPTVNDQTMYLLRNVKNLDTSESAGELIIDIDEKSLSDSYANLLKYSGAKWFLLDNQNNIISNPEKSLLGGKMDDLVMDKANLLELKEIHISGESYISSFKKLKNYNMTSIILIPKKQVFGNLSKNVIGYLYIIAIILVFSLLIGLRFTYKFTKPIKDLSDKIKLVGDGNFNVRMPSYDSIELDKLSTVFNSMTEKMDYLIHDVYQKQLLLRESELKSLHAQMNPHFMFNVLMTIGLEAKMSNNERIYRMVNSFNHLLQANINFAGNEMITLREELNYIDFYLYLQNTRYEDTLKYKLNLQDEGLLDLIIPKFCIQPLIENAVVHGLEENSYAGHIDLNISVHSGLLTIEVADDGIGFETSSFDASSHPFILQPKEGHNNIGLNNINRRIKLIYGNEYGLTIENNSDKGTKVTLHMLADRGDA